MRRREFAKLVAATVAWPITASAQKPMPVIGFLGHISGDPFPGVARAFLSGLEETGYIAGRNVRIEYRWAEGQSDRLPALAADLVGRNVDLIATEGGTVTAHAAKNATSQIPIVYTGGSDPVGDGLVTSLAHPGGNLTGISNFTQELTPKRLELLCELAPQATLIGFLVHPARSYTARLIAAVQQAATMKGLQLTVVNAENESEIGAAFASLVRRQVGGLVVAPDPLFGPYRDQFAALASRHRLPAIYHTRGFVVAGGLSSYGADLYALYRLAGMYAGRILKGERPADLPVQQPTRFEFVLNLKTAKALGLSVPETLLARADEVIE
jgi:putative tryptophan/tyrosine transport system substrate-binding protein